MRLAILMLSAAIMAAAVVPSARAETTYTTRILVEACKAPEESTVGRFCMGYVMGVGDVMTINGLEISKVAGADHEAKLELASLALCTEPSADAPSALAMVQAFKNWAAQHPEALNRQALGSVVIALSETWACPVSN